jgi:hypothetical protein
VYTGDLLVLVALGWSVLITFLWIIVTLVRWARQRQVAILQIAPPFALWLSISALFDTIGTARFPFLNRFAAISWLVVGAFVVLTYGTRPRRPSAGELAFVSAGAYGAAALGASLNVVVLRDAGVLVGAVIATVSAALYLRELSGSSVPAR